MRNAGSLPRHRLLVLSLGLIPLLGFGPCGGTEDDDGGGNGPPEGTGSSIESLITCEVRLTIETAQIKSGSPNVLSPGDTAK